MAIQSHGNVLKDLLFRDKPKKLELLALAKTLPKLVLNEKQVCDLELIITGGFSPLEGFLNKDDYESVVFKNRLSDGTLWTIPITLDVGQNEIDSLKIVAGLKIALLNAEDDEPLAILTVHDVYQPDKIVEATLVYGKNDRAHPAVAYLHDQTKDYYLGGSLQAISSPAHYDNKEIRFTPAELREKFDKWGWNRVVAFQTRNPMHRAHRELTVRAAREHKCNILIHPVVGVTKPGDVDYHTRVRVYRKVIEKYPDGMAALSLLPLAMRMGGPREAVWHAIIRKNHGCTHFIVGRDHAGPGKDSEGNDFYGPYEAQDLVEKFKDELGIVVVPFKMVSYLPDTDEYKPSDQVPVGTKTWSISGTELRNRLKTGADIPSWFTYPEVIQILRQVYPPRSKQGFTVTFVGNYNKKLISLASALESVLTQSGERPTTLLLPNLPVVKPLNSGEIKNFAFAASQIAKAGGATIAVPVSDNSRSLEEYEKQVSRFGGSIVVHVNTSLEEVRASENSSFYQDNQFEFKGLTNTTITADVNQVGVAQILQEIILALEEEGYVGCK